MRRTCAGLLCAALLGLARAADNPQAVAPAGDPAVLAAIPERLGYAFDKPDILIRQRLFGLAHGLSLLAAACLDLPEQARPIQDAYAAWHARQGKTIAILVQDLSHYYFGPRAATARWPDLARALNLNDSIQPSLGQVSLQDACASLPQAITRPRYEFDKLLAEADAQEGQPVTPLAVPPAPTFASPAE